MTDALLLITSSCPYCPGMMQILGDLVKEGKLGRLEIVNITVEPDVAGQYGVRSVPWLRLGESEFSGTMSRGEIEKWISLAGGHDGQGGMLAEQLQKGRLADVLPRLQREPEILGDLLRLLRADDVPLAVRIGVSAAVESLEENPGILREQLPLLLELTRHAEPATRADACHFLALAGGDEARAGIESCLDDREEMVREIARESLHRIDGEGQAD